MATQFGDEFGQLFMAGLPGPEMDDATQDLIRRFRVNNFILFKRNAIHPAQIRLLTNALADACQRQGLAAPLIAIDQEGGTVARLEKPFTRFDNARDYAESPDAEKCLADFARICATELLDVGINMNLAPVLDICPRGQGFFMEKRSFGNDPQQVAHLACLVIRTMENHGLMACAKHFPGLGAAKIDPHLHLPRVAVSQQELAADLIPFQKAIEANVASIMTSHTIYEEIDPAHAATLSVEIIDFLLRRKIGYDGVVITDDLEMGAIENEMAVEEAAVQAFCAGADQLLICHNQEKIKKAHGALLQAYRQSFFSRDRVQHSLARLERLRERFRIG